MKNIPQFFVIFLLITAGIGIVYYSLHRQTFSTDVTASNPSLPGDIKVDITKTWTTYHSDIWGFSISHPFYLKPEQTPEGILFLQLGETQSLNTELFDALSLLISTAPLPENGLERIVNEEYQREKDDPATERLTEVKPITIAEQKGLTYTVTGRTKRSVIFLPKRNNEFIKITDMTVTPPGGSRDFTETVHKMLSTLKF